MFMDKIKAIAQQNKPVANMDKYRKIAKRALLKNAKHGLDYCKIWIPCTIDLDDFNKTLKEDNIECLFLQSNTRNTIYKVYVCERIDPEKFWKQVKYNREHRR